MDELFAQIPGGSRTIFGVVALLALIWGARKLFSGGEKQSAHHRAAQCRSCGWKGQVSAYKPKCPKCAATLG